MGDGVTVRFAHDEGSQDEHVEGSLQHLWAGWLLRFRHVVIPSTRTSMGENDTPLERLWEEFCDDFFRVLFAGLVDEGRVAHI
jgi:hypothetical protein